MATISNIKRTCHACPAQWEGDATTADGKTLPFYARYRWGHFTAYTHDGDLLTPVQIIAEFSRDDPWDGYMEDEQFHQLLTAAGHTVT